MTISHDSTGCIGLACQLSDPGRLPYERPDGRRLCRPRQVEVIARARWRRFRAFETG